MMVHYSSKCHLGKCPGQWVFNSQEMFGVTSGQRTEDKERYVDDKILAWANQTWRVCWYTHRRKKPFDILTLPKGDKLVAYTSMYQQIRFFSPCPEVHHVMDSQDKVAVTEESVLKRRTWYFEKVPHKENIRETRQRIEERTGGRILHQKKWERRKLVRSRYRQLGGEGSFVRMSYL